jgi:hypothetical protein
MGFGILLATVIGAGLMVAGFGLFVGLERLERWLESSLDEPGTGSQSERSSTPDHAPPASKVSR